MEIPPMPAPIPKCDHCGEPIGVYEPMIAMIGEEARETSRAAEPSTVSASTARYHRSCYLDRHRFPSI